MVIHFSHPLASETIEHYTHIKGLKIRLSRWHTGCTDFRIAGWIINAAGGRMAPAGGRTMGR